VSGPTHTLVVYERGGTQRCSAGVAWLEQNGSLTLKLNPGVRISWDDDVTLKLFPQDYNQQRRTEGQRSGTSRSNKPRPGYDDEDVPF